MASPLTNKLVSLAPTALAALLYAFACVLYSGEHEAQRSFKSFGIRFNQRAYPAARVDIERAAALSPANAYYLAGRGLLLARLRPRKFDPKGFLE